jgi:acyl-coenzyme A synthetase/AMP-(fatty) acid ligase
MTIQYINRWARETPDKTALIYNDTPVTYAQFARAVEATRQRLIVDGAPTAGVAAVLTGSIQSAWVLILAARALGLTTVMVTDVRRLGELTLRNLSCLLTPVDEPPPPSDPALVGVVHISVPASILRAAEGLDSATGFVDPPRLGDHILYTSGTTGQYKKVLVEAVRQRARDQDRLDLAGMTSDTVFHATDFGLWTGIGFKSVSADWLAGGTVVIDQTDARYANFRRYAPTYAQTLPESLRAIIDASDPSVPPSTTMRLRCGGSLVPLSLAQRAVARISTWFTVGFSATELGSSAMQSDFHTPDDLLWLTPNRPHRVEIVDEGGAEVGPKVEGFLRFRLDDADSTGYLDDPEATAKAYRDGCFYTGDLAMRREDGRVRILGRADDVLNVKGQKLAVAPIEENLQRGLGVDELCVFLGMAADGVEELVVAIRSKEPLDKDDVLRRLGPSKIFDRVRIEVFPEFPRTQAGLSKIKRTELRRMVFPD